MALSTSNAYQTAVRNVIEGATAAPDTFRSWAQFLTDDVAALRLSSLHGIASIPAWTTGDLVEKTIDTAGTKTISYTAYGCQVTIPRFQSRDLPTLEAMASKKLGSALQNSYETLAYGLANEAWSSSTHSTADAHPLFSAGHTTSTSGVTRSNLLTSGLDRTAVMLAISKMRKFPTHSGEFSSLADRNLTLVVPPDLEQAAREVVMSDFNGGSYGFVNAASADSTFTGMQANVIKSFNMTVTVSPHLSDANNWFICVGGPDAQDSPLIFWERSAPQIGRRVDTDDLSVRLSLDYGVGVSMAAMPDGAVGSAVS